MHITAALSFPLTCIVKGLRQLTKTSVNLAASEAKMRYRCSDASSHSFFHVKHKRFLGVSYHHSRARIPHGDLKNIEVLSFRSLGYLHPGVFEEIVEDEPQSVVRNASNRSLGHPEVQSRGADVVESESQSSPAGEAGDAESKEEGDYASLDFESREEPVESKAACSEASSPDAGSAKSARTEDLYAVPKKLYDRLNKNQFEECSADGIDDRKDVDGRSVGHSPVLHMAADSEAWHLKPKVIGMVMKAVPKDVPAPIAHRGAMPVFLKKMTLKMSVSRYAEPYDNFLQGMTRTRLALVKNKLGLLAKKMDKRGNSLWQAIGHCDREYGRIYTKEFRDFFFSRIGKTESIAESVDEILRDAHTDAAAKASQAMQVSGSIALKDYAIFLSEVDYAKRPPSIPPRTGAMFKPNAPPRHPSDTRA